MKEKFTYPKRRICVVCDQDVPASPVQHADIVYTTPTPADPHKGCKPPPHWTDALNLGRRKVTLGPVMTTELKNPVAKQPCGHIECECGRP